MTSDDSSNNGDNQKSKENLDYSDSESTENESELGFGGIKPLTAAQVVSFLLISEKSMGACACGPCSGPCY